MSSDLAHARWDVNEAEPRRWVGGGNVTRLRVRIDLIAVDNSTLSKCDLPSAVSEKYCSRPAGTS